MTKDNWIIPETFPDLSGARVICVDVETRDDDLKSRGPGVRRGAYIVGVAVGTDDGFRAYYPVAHDEGPNLDGDAVFAWLRGELCRDSQIVLGANIMYDADFLAEENIEIHSPMYDVQVAEPLIDENARGHYNLDDLGIKYLGQPKVKTKLEIECERRKYRGDVRKHLWKLPADLVGPYAIGDVDIPLGVFPKQKKILRGDGLWDLFLMETSLLPLLLRMRRVGVRIDMKRLNVVTSELERQLREWEKTLNHVAGMEVNYRAGASVARAFDSAGIRYPRTKKTDAPSFRKEFLTELDHSLAQAVVACRRLDKFIGTFLNGQIREQIVNGRIHTTFNSLKSDEYGTVTGRLSSSKPNLQNIPNRDKELGPMCRSLFIPEPRCLWGKSDYSQIEFRIFAHYAIGTGSDSFRQTYQENPNTDYHQLCADVAGIDRGSAKTANFAVIYGAGLTRAAKQLNMDIGDAAEFLDAYHERFPFAKGTARKVAAKAIRRGWIRTVLGRRRRFNRWEPLDWDLVNVHDDYRVYSHSKSDMVAYVERKRAEAREAGNLVPVPGIRRANTHKAFNALIQGSAADVMKKAMSDALAAGIFDTLTPHLTVHDELDVSIPKNKTGREAWRELKDTMEKAVEFNVPLVVDAAIGKNWGDVK